MTKSAAKKQNNGLGSTNETNKEALWPLDSFGY